MAYSEVSDLLLGSTPVSQLLDKGKFVSDAADEIDSRIGVRYVIPIDTTDPTTVAPHICLLLKRINNFLATGRLIMALAMGGEDKALHAYGYSLVREAQAALTQIENGTIILDGAPENDTNTGHYSGPTIKNADAASSVDAFYSRVMTPETPLTYRDWAPGDDPTGSAIPVSGV